MAKNLVIVESPAKAKTIKKFLGSSYQVIASNGHVRDLPKSQMGVDIEHDFEPKYITIRGKGELLNQLKKEVKKADRVYLATDPDREGEAISWHLMAALNLDPEKTLRITFNEITKEAVKGSLKKARKIDENLVDAQQARRVLDRIVGYQVSPVLWKKVKKGLSAGRVQSAALKLLCDREKEISEFEQEEFWTLEADFLAKSGSTCLKARLTAVDGEKPRISNEAESRELCRTIEKQPEWTVTELKKGKRSRKAPDPFITSTLQQEASKRLNFSPQKTMRIAQQLYEGVELPDSGAVGLISYLRTDSVRISEEAKSAAAEYIREHYGEACCGENHSENKHGKIQDAHEAIRPTYIQYPPQKVEEYLSRDQYRLYKLIWERFIASQMAAAEYETYAAEIQSGQFRFSASGSRLVFPGFNRVYQDTEEETAAGEYQNVDALQKGSVMSLNQLQGQQHFTQPPAHFTEASLVKALEENGVGRPSTYAPIIATLLMRGYVAKEKKLLYVTELGEIVNQMISSYFDEIVDIHFTAQMEEELDHVEEGTCQWKEVIRSFYDKFSPSLEKAMKELEKVKLEDEVTDVICEKCGRNMVLKMGKYGKFYACPGFPECHNAKPYYEELGVSCPLCGAALQIRKTKKGRTYYGCERAPECSFMSWERPTEQTCPRCGERLYLKNGKQRMMVCLKEGCGYKTEAPQETSEE